MGYNLFAYCENNPVMRYDPLGDFGWDNLFEGALLMAIGVMTVAAVALTGGSCIPLVALAYAAVATSGTLLVGLGATEVIEGFTGVNPVRDEMGEETYETVKALALGVASMAPAVISVGSEISTCFVAGTQISTEEGVIAIEDICVGMKVYAHDPETGETALKEVVNTFVRESGELVHITVNGEEITTTPTHPFYVPQKGWTDAIRLRAGDRLQLLNGEYVVVEQVQHEILEAPVTVYNFEVEEFHTYYVTGSAILVHNKCLVNENGVRVDVRTSNEHGLPHAHVSGNGPNTTVGLDGYPMRGHPNFSKQQFRVIEKNWEIIKKGIELWFK